MGRKYLVPASGVVRAMVGAWFQAKRNVEHWKPALFVYTDSRGFRVDRWYSRKNPVGSYISSLSKTHRLTYGLCPYRHTTLIDFLYDVRNRDLSDYSAIILHVGVVDFSPRPISQARAVLLRKEHRIRALFGSAASRFQPWEYEDDYDGEPTASLYSPDVLSELLLPEIRNLPVRLIWIGINPILIDWRGNYGRERPRNINVVTQFQARIDAERGFDVVSLAHWGPAEIRQMTVDNIHLSSEGNMYLTRELLARLRADE